jgi:hypothetical protein
LPATATPLVSGGDLDQDGWPEVVVDVPVALDAASEALLDRRRHKLFVLGAEPGSGFAITSEVGIAGAESRENCLRVANLDGDPAPEILLIAAPDLYLFDRQLDESLLPIAYASGFRSTTVAVSDLDRDGRLEVFPGGDRVLELEARDGTIPGPLPPAGLRARIDQDGAILLEWNPGADRFRLYRANGAAVDCATAPVLAEVTVPSYRDTTAGAIATYRVSGITAGQEGECSLPLTVARETAPRLLEARADGPRGVRVQFSAPMDGSASDLGNYRLTGPADETLPISSAISIASERGRLLVLGRDLEPGPHVLEVGPVRSLAGVVLAGPNTVGFQVIPSAPLQPLHLVRAEPAGADAVLAGLSAPPDTLAGVFPSSFELAGGFTILAAEVESTTVRLRLDASTPLRPGVFRLRLAPGLRGARGETVVVGEGDELELVVGGELVAYPNPYDVGRAVADGVTFAGLDPGAEIVLLDALGRERTRLQAGARGTAYLVVRGRPEFTSGVYLFRVEGASGVQIGKLAIRR